MSRLTNHAYLATHHQLHAEWITDPTSFFLLDAMEQWALHEYFRFSESLDLTTLTKHRKMVSKGRSSLPQRAGKAAAKWRVKQDEVKAYRALPHPSRKGTKRSQNYAIRLFADVNPTLDPAQFAKVILDSRVREQYAAKHPPKP